MWWSLLHSSLPSLACWDAGTLTITQSLTHNLTCLQAEQMNKASFCYASFYDLFIAVKY